MDISNLTFPRTKFRRGYNVQEVDEFLSLAAADLALPLDKRTLGPEQVTSACFTATQFRPGYDERCVDRVMSQIAVEIGQR